MKRIASIFLCGLLLLTATNSHAATPITVTLDYAEVEFSQPPIIINDRTLVPVRAIFEAMGASVTWDGAARTITSVLADTTVLMTLDKNEMTVNKEIKALDCAPQLVEGTTMVPTRAVAESFGCTVLWDDTTRSVSICSPAFAEKVKTAKEFRSVRKITHDDKTAEAAFSIPYFEEYATKTHAVDGTDFEITHTTETGHASLSVRSDIYIGADTPLTEDYAKSVADDMVSMVSGTLLSCGVVQVNDLDFIKIEYTAPRNVFGIYDADASITVYMGRKNGVVYTMTNAMYGTVSRTVIGDFYYMMHALLIA